MTYLYLPLIPDVAIVRDNCPANAAAWQRQLYKILALGWRGNREQWRRLEKAVSIMAIFITPVAISVHTITSWILATTVQPGWHSSIFGPYFVVGALFSGIGALFLAMTVIRRGLKLQDYITDKQYWNLGLLFITMVGVWAYFTLNESMGIAAAQQLEEFPLLEAKLWGQHSLSFWLMVGLHGFAFWVLVAPKLLPESLRQWDMLRPVPALVATNIAALALLMLIWPEPTIAGIDLSTPELAPLLWVLVFCRFHLGWPGPGGLAKGSAGHGNGYCFYQRGHRDVARALAHHRADHDPSASDTLYDLFADLDGNLVVGRFNCSVLIYVSTVFQVFPGSFHLGDR